MAILKLPDNGQETQLDDTIARSDDLLKQALAIVMPGASNIDISRQERDGQLIVTVIKKAGSKGSGWLDYLKAVQETNNPAVELAAKFQAMEASGETIDWDQLIVNAPDIDRALILGQNEAQRVSLVYNRLQRLPAVPSSKVPEGF